MYKLSKQNILRKNKHFQAVYRSGRSYANKMAVLYVLPQSSGGRRIGFAAGKRLGGAVVRNRLKRVMREAYRLNQNDMPFGFDFIFVARRPMIDADSSTVAKALLDLCRKAKILHHGDV